MRNILVIGLGKVGSLVGTLLSKRFTVTGIDKVIPDTKLPFQVMEGDILKPGFLEGIFSDFDGVVSCMPYNLNLPISILLKMCPQQLRSEKWLKTAVV
jgi:saccharopine dehydrogenase-like NADP-dependent oxidoreductase